MKKNFVYTLGLFLLFSPISVFAQATEDIHPRIRAVVEMAESIQVYVEDFSNNQLGAVLKSLSVNSTSSSCLVLTQGLFYGYKDQKTKGEVSKLQKFLSEQGYSDVQVTGVFGKDTRRAVADWQLKNKVSATGYVGPQTRAMIQRLTCGVPVISKITAPSVKKTEVKTVKTNVSTVSNPSSVGVGGSSSQGSTSASGVATTSTQSYSISSLGGQRSSYTSLQIMSFDVKGFESDGTPTLPEEGFEIIVRIFSANGTVPVKSSGATFNAGGSFWSFSVGAPEEVGAYTAEIVLSCSSNSNLLCTKRYPSSFSAKTEFNFSVTAPVVVNFDACRLDKLDGINITRDVIEDKTQCLAKICDVFGPANLSSNIESKCVFNGQEIKRYTVPVFVPTNTTIQESFVSAVRNRQFTTSGGQDFIAEFDVDGDGKIASTDVILMRNFPEVTLVVYTNIQTNMLKAVRDRQFTKTGDIKFITELDLDKDGKIASTDVILARNFLGQPYLLSPVIENVTGLVLNDFEIDYTKASLVGKNLVGISQATTSVFLQNKELPITQLGDSLIWFSVPKDVLPPGAYDLYVENNKGKSVPVKVTLINTDPVPTITLTNTQIHDKLIDAVRQKQFTSTGNINYVAEFDINNNGIIQSTDLILVRNFPAVELLTYEAIRVKMEKAISDRQGSKTGDTNFIVQLDLDSDGDIDSFDLGFVRTFLNQAQINP